MNSLHATPKPTGRSNRLRRYDAPLGVGQGLRHVRETLARWGLDGTWEQSTDAVLLAGELLANARGHGGGANTVEVSLRGTRLRISVSDASREPPQLVLPHVPARPHGHGLYLVDRLAWRWGSFAQRHGKTVWVEMRAPARSGPSTSLTHTEDAHP